MSKRKWTFQSAVAILGDMVIAGAKVVYLHGKGTLTLNSAADYLVREYGYTVR